MNEGARLDERKVPNGNTDDITQLLSLLINSRHIRGMLPTNIDMSNVKTITNYLRISGSISSQEKEKLDKFYGNK
ncbi:hypothetical protein MOD76_19705 [Bacillus spizizenii]|nr:hypothetical protein [Bacillus spizizenii]MCY8902923.1 hypothetical protein [Bacillus spizizenii]MCY8907052.1 hypothetical protein [Bacillus spizizenii]